MKYKIIRWCGYGGIAIGVLLFFVAFVSAHEKSLVDLDADRTKFEPTDLNITIDGCAPVAVLNENGLTVFIGNAKIIFSQSASGKFGNVKIEGGDTGFYWDESGNVHFCIGGVEVEK